MESTSSTSPLGGAIRQTVVLAMASVALALLAIRLADVILMAFGAGLVAVLLNALAEPLHAQLRLRRPLALTLAVAATIACVASAIWIFGRQAEAQFAALDAVLPRALDELQSRLSTAPFGGAALAKLEDWRGFGWLVSLGPKLAADAAGGLAGTIIVLFAGLYLAYHPGSYVGGALMLFPRPRRERARQVLDQIHRALRQWLVGQLCSMALVGVTTGIGLAMVGVPSAAALGLIAGIGQFVPVIGPMVATLPGLLVALEAGPQTLLWAGLVYLVSAQLEANLITPLVLRQLVQLPMAVTLFAVLAMGVLLGPLGVLFATPLAVVVYVFVRMVYVEGVLGETLGPSV
ncbi:AI-2E family transporter [Caulobacter sp.]|uniref:AI-2E family transporter n=1 Tax=Caulobacter sp. TaxID=78 RepID=UPI002B475164|nr:AI-2E family transporter [Caulobacter sp.]HJV43074.1 AI-2E family transporter [Caulobacter sp.]